MLYFSRGSKDMCRASRIQPRPRATDLAIHHQRDRAATKGSLERPLPLNCTPPCRRYLRTISDFRTPVTVPFLLSRETYLASIQNYSPSCVVCFCFFAFFLIFLITSHSCRLAITCTPPPNPPLPPLRAAARFLERSHLLLFDIILMFFLAHFSFLLLSICQSPSPSPVSSASGMLCSFAWCAQVRSVRTADARRCVCVCIRRSSFFCRALIVY